MEAGLDWYDPASHAVHTAVEANGAYSPGLHAVGAVEPMEHSYPASHVVHPAWSTMSELE